MKTADQLNVGDYFVGHCDRQDFYAGKYERRSEFVRRRVMDGKLITVVVVCFYDSRDIMKMFAALPHEDPQQLSSDLSLWVAGQRDKRSARVSILDWSMRKWQRQEAA